MAAKKLTAKELERKISYVLSVLRTSSKWYEGLANNGKEVDQYSDGIKKGLEMAIVVVKDITGVEKEEE